MTTSAQEILGEEEARKAVEANISPRYRRLDELERWAKGTQYTHLQSWWDSSNDKPLWERAPCIVQKFVSNAAQSNIDLCMGSHRFPTFSTKQGEDEEEEENGLSQEESDVIDRFIHEYHRIARFRKSARQSFFEGQTTGTSVVIHGVRNDKPFAESVPAKWCTPTFDADDNVVSIEIRYPYTEQVQLATGKTKLVAKLYRRVITTEKDVEYYPAEADKNGTEPSWRKNDSRSTQHNLGFCPVIWYAFGKQTTTVSVIDGEAIHRWLTDELHQHDIARSQWHRGALLSEPQIVETGVSQGYNPTEVGRGVNLPSTETGGHDVKQPETIGSINGAYVDRRIQQSARKKGAGFVWTYPNEETKVFAITYPGDALEAQRDNVMDLRIGLQHSLGVMFTDPENMKFASMTSGKALRELRERQINRCGTYREDLEQNLFEPSVQMQLRIAYVMLSRGQRLRVPGASKALPLLKRFSGTSDGVASWHGPILQIKWGPFYELDAEEQAKIVSMVKAAVSSTKEGAAIMTLRKGIERVAEIFGVDNVGSILKELEEEGLQDVKEEAPGPSGVDATVTPSGAAGDEPGGTGGDSPGGDSDE